MEPVRCVLYANQVLCRGMVNRALKIAPGNNLTR